MKTPKRCLEEAEKAIESGKSVAIDNTNRTAKDRQKYIELAEKHKIPIRCFFFDIPKEVCMHNNT